MANKVVPLRQFIFDRLYHPAGGYFCRPDFQVGELSEPFDFKKLLGFDQYQEELAKRYPKNAWLTPSEIFKPYYGMSIGKYIEQAEQRLQGKKQIKGPIRIVEAGAGTGSAADSILFYFKNFKHHLIDDLEYNIVEISPALCEHAERKLKKNYPYLMQKGKIKIYNRDILSYSNPNRCYSIFLEVMDNLPHDKVVKNAKTGTYDTFSMVNLDTKKQQYASIEKDKLIKQCLQLHLKAQKFKQTKSQNASFVDRMATKIVNRFYSASKKQEQLFLPTYLLKLFKSIKANMPNAHLIMGDFDSLNSTIPGQNAPIVSFKGEESSKKQDYSTYLVDRGAADIFFPVDFQLLRTIHRVILGRDSDYVKSHQFFDEFGVEDWTNSRSGFNPLKQDFGNTSFLVSRVR